jgi:hypothetical protein
MWGIFSLSSQEWLCSMELSIRGLSGKYPAILNISRTVRVALTLLDSQSEETWLCIREQSLSCGASQSAVTSGWLILCTVWTSHSRISSFSKAILALGKARNRREPNLGCRAADRPGWCEALPKKLAQELWNEHAHCRDEDDMLAGSLLMRRSHSTQSQSTASHCRLTSPTGERLFTDVQWGLLWLSAKLYQGHTTGSRDLKMAGYFPDSLRLWYAVKQWIIYRQF